MVSKEIIDLLLRKNEKIAKANTQKALYGNIEFDKGPSTLAKMIYSSRKQYPVAIQFKDKDIDTNIDEACILRNALLALDIYSWLPDPNTTNYILTVHYYYEQVFTETEWRKIMADYIAKRSVTATTEQEPVTKKEPVHEEGEKGVPMTAAESIPEKHTGKTVGVIITIHNSEMKAFEEKARKYSLPISNRQNLFGGKIRFSYAIPDNLLKEPLKWVKKIYTYEEQRM